MAAASCPRDAGCGAEAEDAVANLDLEVGIGKQQVVEESRAVSITQSPCHVRVEKQRRQVGELVLWNVREVVRRRLVEYRPRLIVNRPLSA